MTEVVIVTDIAGEPVILYCAVCDTDKVGVCETVFVFGNDVANGDALLDIVFVTDIAPVFVTV